MNDLGRLATSLAHTRPSQVAARLRLACKRRVCASLARLAPAFAPGSDDDPPAIAPDPPLPIFPPRAHLASTEHSQPRARFLGKTFALAAPVDWTPAVDAPCARLAPLTLHYMEFLEAQDDAGFERLTRDWIDHNPPYAPGYWRESWSAYALSIRCVVWMQQIAARRARLRPEIVQRLRAALAAQIRFLASNLEVDLGGNHLVKNAKALLWAGRFFAGQEAAAWSALGRRILARELPEQILADGHHFERSPAYHLQVFADLLECWSVLPAPAREPLGARLDAMAQAAADLTHPDGATSLFNDGGLAMAYPAAQSLAVHQSLLGRGVEPRRVFALDSAGFFGVRGERSLLVVDCGAIAPDHLPAHGHGDALSFEWSVGGERVVVDAGTYEYEAGEDRAWSRSTRAHNTVTVGDADQCEFWSSFRVARRARVQCERFEPRTDGFVLVGSHDGFAHLAGAPRHRRRIDASAREIHVQDEVLGGAGQTVRARLLLHPDARVVRDGAGITIERGRASVRLETASAIACEPSAWSPDLGVRIRTTQIVLDYGAAPCAGGFRLVEAGA